jgi:hypothetical protein
MEPNPWPDRYYHSSSWPILTMDALENAGRQPASVYPECNLYTTLSPY